MVALVLQPKTAERPSLPDDGAEHVLAEAEVTGDVILAHHETVSVGGPAGGQNLVANHGAVEVSLDDAQRGDAQRRPVRQFGHVE